MAKIHPIGYGDGSPIPNIIQALAVCSTEELRRISRTIDLEIAARVKRMMVAAK